MEQPRDSHGRFKADHTKRNIAVAAAAGIGALAAGLAAALRFGALDRFLDKEGHQAPDLAEDAPRPGSAAAYRAPVDFRPDPTASVPASEREALRPAVLPAES